MCKGPCSYLTTYACYPSKKDSLSKQVSAGTAFIPRSAKAIEVAGRTHTVIAQHFGGRLLDLIIAIDQTLNRFKLEDLGQLLKGLGESEKA